MESEFVTVATFRTPPEAELAKEQLSNEGIRAFLSNEMAVGVMPYLGSGLGGIELKVSVADVERTREILAISEKTTP